METRTHLFPHEVPAYLHISRSDFDTLRKYGSFSKIERLSGTCVFFYKITKIDDFLQYFQTPKDFQDHIDYLNSIDRQE